MGQLPTPNNDTEVRAFSSSEAAQFTGIGDWLEVYVWHEVKQRGFADDYQWGCKVSDGQVENELDLAVLYKAQLLIAECKTDQNPFQGRRNYLGKLDAIANLLGGTYVTQVFITNQYGTEDSYNVFCEQAKQRNIVVTAEALPTKSVKFWNVKPNVQLSKDIRYTHTQLHPPAHTRTASAN